ncbi:MAG: hypothetical protein E2577_18115, partial [Starkeya sp.]|nr:hypothetical protein [Starkeya sp.]
IQKLRVVLIETRATSTVNHYLATIRGIRRGWITTDGSVRWLAAPHLAWAGCARTLGSSNKPPNPFRPRKGAESAASGSNRSPPSPGDHPYDRRPCISRLVPQGQRRK